MTSNLRSRFDRELVHRFGIVAVLLLISVALAATTDSFSTSSTDGPCGPRPCSAPRARR